MSTNYIKQITDTAGTTHDLMESVDTRIFRATCETATSTAAKVATLEDSTGYSLTTGVKVAVYFKYGNSALSPTLQVTNGSDAAKTIAYPDSASGVTYGGALASWGNNEVVIFVYNGSVWVCCGSALGIYKAYNLANSYKGTVTSVGLSNDTDGGLTITSSPVTSSGTIKIKHTNILSSAQTTSGLYPIKIDKNGHISEYGTAVTVPTIQIVRW